MDLITASLDLSNVLTTHSPSTLADLLTTRLSSLPAVEHVRTRVVAAGLGIVVFVTSTTPDDLVAIEASIRAEIASVTRAASGH